MKINRKTINHIKESEGLSLTAYPDPGSVNGKPVTIGYGTTKIGGKPIELGTKITKAQAEEYLEADLIAFGTKVAAMIKVPVNDDQFGALVSFAYNVGLSAFSKSTLLRVLNEGKYSEVPDQMRRWNKNDGKVMKGLVNRREKEIALWNSTTPAEPTEKPAESVSPKPATNVVKTIIDLLVGFIKALFGRKN